MFADVRTVIELAGMTNHDVQRLAEHMDYICLWVYPHDPVLKKRRDQIYEELARRGL